MKKQPPSQFEIACSTIFENCSYRADGETADEATHRLMAHAHSAHGMAVTTEVAARARQAVRPVSQTAGDGAVKR